MDGADIIVPVHESSLIAREPGGHYVIFSQLPAR